MSLRWTRRGPFYHVAKLPARLSLKRLPSYMFFSPLGTVLGMMFLSEGCLRGLQDEDCMWGGDGQGKTELPVGG